MKYTFKLYPDDEREVEYEVTYFPFGDALVIHTEHLTEFKASTRDEAETIIRDVYERHNL